MKPKLPANTSLIHLIAEVLILTSILGMWGNEVGRRKDIEFAVKQSWKIEQQSAFAYKLRDGNQQIALYVPPIYPVVVRKTHGP